MNIVVKCSEKNHTKNIIRYRPVDGEQHAKRQQEFDEILERIRVEGETSQLVVRLHHVRTKKCCDCRQYHKKSNENPSTEIGKCRAKWYEFRDSAICVDCGTSKCIEFDHIIGEKVHKLSNYFWWSCNGGVDAMEIERKKCVPRCRFCHSLQPSHSSKKRKYEHTNDMPTSTTQEKRVKWNRQNTDDKYAYVNNIKLDIGKCQRCKLKVTKDTCIAFQFAHKNALEKEYSVSQICSRKTKLETTKALIDTEISRCNLLCANCHKEETDERR